MIPPGPNCLVVYIIVTLWLLWFLWSLGRCDNQMTWISDLLSHSWTPPACQLQCEDISYFMLSYLVLQTTNLAGCLYTLYHFFVFLLVFRIT